MSEEITGGAQPQAISDPTEKQTEKINNSPVEDYKRDMFKFKSEAKELKDKLKEYELREQESKGNLQEVIAKLKEENRTYKTELAQSNMNFAQGKIEEAIKTEALKRGCKDADTFYRLIDSTDIKTIELDTKFNVNKDDVSNILDRYSKDYGHLGFFKNKVNIADASPRTADNTSSKKGKSLDEMSHEELMAEAQKIGLRRINN